MNEIKVKDILKICDGELICGNEEDICENFCKDTRVIKKGDTYVGIKGENFDGNTLYKEAIEKGAKVCILQNIKIDEKEISGYENRSIIIVKDTIKAIGEIAKFKREQFGKNMPVVAVTGSVGKTSTKDIVASVLLQEYKVLKTKGNMNNHIGLPFTILQLKEQEALVIEMGMNHFGEIRYLTNIAKPSIAVITNIGTSHIGNLGSRENILKAKLEILESEELKSVVINNDNDLLHCWYLKNKSNYEVYTYGIDNVSDIMARNIKLEENSSKFLCEIGKENMNVEVPIGGKHFIYNSLCATTIGKILNIKDEKILKGIKEFKLTKKRMDIENIHNITIINDSYNASYDSMKAGLEYLDSVKGNRKIAVLGDMLELGTFSKELHEKVGNEVINNNVDILVTVGKNAEYISRKAVELGMKKEKVYTMNDNNETVEVLKEILEKEDVILFKASNAMNFTEIINKIKGEI